MNFNVDHCRAESKNALKLRGGIIVGTVVDDQKGFWGLRVRLPKSNKPITVWVDRDPEGNGPGHLGIEPEKES